jgi:hypothetical protein
MTFALRKFVCCEGRSSLGAGRAELDFVEKGTLRRKKAPDLLIGPQLGNVLPSFPHLHFKEAVCNHSQASVKNRTANLQSIGK